MDEHKPDEPPRSHDPSRQEEDSAAGLCRKLAQAYSTLPPEERTAKRRGGYGHVSNPELERAFSELLQSYRAAPPQQSDPEAADILRRQLERQEAGIATREPSRVAKVEGVDFLIGEQHKTCSGCGQPYPVGQDSCDSCGVPPESPAELAAAEATVRVDPGSLEVKPPMCDSGGGGGHSGWNHARHPISASHDACSLESTAGA